MFSKMLVLLDGSELAEVVFPFAKELAAGLNANVVLLQVYGPLGKDFILLHQSYIQRSAEKIRQQVKEAQERLGVPEEERQVEVQGELAGGHYADEILRFVDENEIDLILMASHGRSGIRRWHIGGVASKVLRAARVPILFIRADVEDAVPYDRWPSRTVLVPLDGSEMGESVLPSVEALAKRRTNEPISVTLLRVCDPPIAPSYYSPEISGVPLNWGEFMEQELNRCKQEATDYLQSITKRFEDQDIQAQSEILVGKAADVIIEYAGKNPFSIIAMATHGRSGLSRLVFGSVTASVLHGVSNPILLTKPEQPDSSK